MFEPTTAPSNVAAFQQTNRVAPVSQNAAERSRGVVWAAVIAVVSSITSWLATSRRPSEPTLPRYCAIVSPYTVFRAARTIAPPSAEAVERTAAIRLTALNCEGPANTTSDIARARHTPAPADTAPAPNTAPNTPTATPSVRAGATTLRSSGSSGRRIGGD